MNRLPLPARQVVVTTIVEVPPDRPPSADQPSLRISRVSLLAHVVVGAVAGATFGAVFRLWMRLISVDPEFTMSGTMFIVAAFTILGANTGLVLGARRRRWKASLVVTRTVAIVLSLACFAAAGAVMLPTMMLGGLALGRRDWPRWLRLSLGLVAVLSTGIVLAELGDLSPAKTAIAFSLYLVLCAVEASAFGVILAPSVGRLPRWLAVAALVVGVLMIVGVVFAMVGVASS